MVHHIIKHLVATPVGFHENYIAVLVRFLPLIPAPFSDLLPLMDVIENDCSMMILKNIHHLLGRAISGKPSCL